MKNLEDEVFAEYMSEHHCLFGLPMNCALVPLDLGFYIEEMLELPSNFLIEGGKDRYHVPFNFVPSPFISYLYNMVVINLSSPFLLERRIYSKIVSRSQTTGQS